MFHVEPFDTPSHFAPLCGSRNPCTLPPVPKRATSTSFGALRGNTARPSRSPLVNDVRLVRQRYREAAAQTIAYLRQVALGQLDGTTHADRLKAADLLAKYGIGTQQEVTGAGGAPLTVRVVRDDRADG